MNSTIPTIALELPSVKPPVELRECAPTGLVALQASLEQFAIPFAYRCALEDYLTDSERAKLSLFESIKEGLKEAAEIFSPKRYGTSWTNDKVHREAELWLRILWRESVSAKQAERAFEAHLTSGRKFPSPAQILALVKPEASR